MGKRSENEETKGKKKKEPKAHKENWKEYTASVEDIRWFLADNILLRHNTVTRKVEYRVPEGDPFSRVLRLESSPQWKPITDEVLNSLWMALSQEKKTKPDDIWRVIQSDNTPDYDPFRYYLDHLPPWDGQNHILALSASVMVKGGVDEQMRFYEYLRKWLVGMVAGWINPKVVNNLILVLIGEQGSYKTTWFNHLLPPDLQPYFYTKTNASKMARDDILKLAEKGLICCEELDTIRPTELNQLKAAVTMPYIDERAPYAHYTDHRPHIASFCGTGNNLQFLSDETGNRRWLPFEVDTITSPLERPFDYDNVYAEAYALYRQGFTYWFSRCESEDLETHNRQFETPHMEKELIEQYFRRPGPREPGEFMPVSLALQIVGAGIVQKLNSVSLGRAFRELGFQGKNTGSTRGYIVVRRSSDEMRSMRYAMAVASDDLQLTDLTDVF